MARRYGVVGMNTNTTSATQPIFNLTGSATLRPKIYEWKIGSESSPSAATALYKFQRASARGAQSVTVTPNPIDGITGAASTTCDVPAWSTNPTLTGSAFVDQIALNQYNSFRWLAAPGYELEIPATAGAGLALVAAVLNGSAFNCDWSLFFEE